MKCASLHCDDEATGALAGYKMCDWHLDMYGEVRAAVDRFCRGEGDWAVDHPNGENLWEAWQTIEWLCSEGAKQFVECRRLDLIKWRSDGAGSGEWVLR